MEVTATLEYANAEPRRDSSRHALGMSAGAAAAMCALGLLLPLLVSAAGPFGLPDPKLTPGSLNPAVAQNNIGETICSRGWKQSIRPPTGYQLGLMEELIQAYGYANKDPEAYQLDSL